MPPLDFKLKQPAASIMVALSAAFPFAVQAAAGRVDFAVGDVRALGPDGRSRPLAKGATFDNGETIETGPNGRAQLRFTDGAQVSLQPQSQFRIDDYSFSGQVDGSEKGFFSLLKGGLRTITGWVGRTNRDKYKVTTAVATIGIRGTEYSVTYGNSITVTTGEGIIEICNAAGCLILNSGETAYVADGSTQPTMTDKKADVPPPPPQDEVQFSVAENTDSSGEPTIISGGGLMTSGPGYQMRGIGYNIGFATKDISGSATFSGNILTFMDGGATTASASGTYSGSADGIIGWGYWDTAAMTNDPYSSWSDFHYVVGVPTTSADINSLSGTVNYSLLGATTPSTTGSSVGSVSSASLQVNFAGGTATIPVSGFSLTTTGGLTIFNTLAVTNASAGSPLFSGSNMNCSGGIICNSASASGSFSGFFAGSNAARAGITYQLDTVSSPGTVSGSAAFTQ